LPSVFRKANNANREVIQRAPFSSRPACDSAA
jgi:hypothetical protein